MNHKHPGVSLSLFTTLWLLQVTSARQLNCTVSLDNGFPTYKIPVYKASDCNYWWTNGSDHVMANHLNTTDPLVKTKNDTSVTLYKCEEEMKYKRDCISEKILCEAICRVDCSQYQQPEQSQIGSAFVVVIVSLVVVVVLLLLLFLCCKKKFRSCGPHREAEQCQTV